MPIDNFEDIPTKHLRFKINGVFFHSGASRTLNLGSRPCSTSSSAAMAGAEPAADNYFNAAEELLLGPVLSSRCENGFQDERRSREWLSEIRETSRLKRSCAKAGTIVPRYVDDRNVRCF